MDLNSAIQLLSMIALPLLFAVTLHEVAHGFVAYWLGDYTAKLSGRLSLNPAKHIDLVGTIIVPVMMLLVTDFKFMFGWAKPVPIDPRNLKNPRRDSALIALAGPLSNLIMAVLWGLVAKLGDYLWNDYSNQWFGQPLFIMGYYGIIINLVLGLLNLIPIPPLDGGRILLSILPRRWAYQYSKIEPFGFYILLFLLIFNVLNLILGPSVDFLRGLILTLLGLKL